MSYINTIIGQFNIFWRPQTISVAKNIYNRFMAGEDLTTLCYDYEVGMVEAENVIRFFVLKGKRNPKAIKLYADWQRKRFKGKSYE